MSWRITEALWRRRIALMRNRKCGSPLFPALPTSRRRILKALFGTAVVGSHSTTATTCGTATISNRKPHPLARSKNRP